MARYFRFGLWSRRSIMLRNDYTSSCMDGKRWPFERVQGVLYHVVARVGWQSVAACRRLVRRLPAAPGIVRVLIAVQPMALCAGVYRVPSSPFALPDVGGAFATVVTVCTGGGGRSQGQGPRDSSKDLHDGEVICLTDVFRRGEEKVGKM